MMLQVTVLAVALSAVSAQEPSCQTHMTEACDSAGENWVPGTCSSVYGGFKGNTNNLHRLVVDDFTDSMTYMLMASRFSSDEVNRMGFSKYFMEFSDKMWGRGKDMIKYIAKRGGKMGPGFQIPDYTYDYTTEMKALGVTLDLLKVKTEDVAVAYKHSLTTSKAGNDPSFDPAIAHMLEELSEDYSGDINEVANNLNTLGKLVRNPRSNALALHMFDQKLLG